MLRSGMAMKQQNTRLRTRDPRESNMAFLQHTSSAGLFFRLNRGANPQPLPLWAGAISRKAPAIRTMDIGTTSVSQET
jgi:hypothetical protein